MTRREKRLIERIKALVDDGTTNPIKDEIWNICNGLLNKNEMERWANSNIVHRTLFRFIKKFNL